MKAYDQVDWEYLDKVFGKFGFKGKWRRWICSFLSWEMFSIILNGTPTIFFSTTQGVSQGDLLSPFPFIIMVQALSRLTIHK